MNFKKDFTIEQQNLLKQADVIVEDKNYSKEEIKSSLNSITYHIMSQSSKNGVQLREMLKYNELMNKLSKYES